MGDADAKKLTGLVLAAGLSSRFGGNIKGLAKIGPNDETLLELALQQAKNCGITDLVVITSDKTQTAIEGLLGSNFLGMPVAYATQTTPAWRKKPMGTVQAVLAARPLLHSSFVVLNGDTIFGEAPLRLVCDYMLAHPDADTACLPAYKLGVCLPADNNRVNRAKVERDAANHLVSIVEQYDICLGDLGEGKAYTGEEMTSLNMFGFRPQHLELFQRKFDEFCAELDRERSGAEGGAGADAAGATAATPGAKPKKDFTAREYILADVVNMLKPEGNFETVVLGPTDQRPLEITHPDDAAALKAVLSARA